MRILVCGGRDFKHIEWFLHCMEPYIPQVTYLITGGATGVDTFAYIWGRREAKLADGHNLVFAAEWDKHEKAAGPIRNQVMLDAGRPDLVIAFPGGRGTADMIGRAKRQNIAVTMFTERDYHQWLKFEGRS